MQSNLRYVIIVVEAILARQYSFLNPVVGSNHNKMDFETIYFDLLSTQSKIHFVKIWVTVEPVEATKEMLQHFKRLRTTSNPKD